MVSKSDYSLLRSLVDVLGFLILTLIAIVVSLIKMVLPKSYQYYKPLKREIVLVTGGGGGLGRLIAMRLAKLEAIVVVWDVNISAIEETVTLVRGIGGVAHGFKCDLADKEDVYRVAKITQQKVGNVSVLINNAGVLSGKFLMDTPDHLIQRTFDVNILAHFWTVKAFLPQMIAKNHGHIVTISSMAGFVGISKLVDYCASKYAAVGFDEALRVELESQGIKGVKTTVICPYFIQSTGMFENVKSRFLPTLNSNDVADRVIEGLRREECVVMLPDVFKVGMVLKFMMPWATVSMFLRNLVPDAAPVHATSEKNSIPELSAHTSIPKEQITTLNHRNGINGKNAL